MKNAVILYFALMMSVGAASASGIEQMLISDLAAEGFTRVEVKRGVTQLKVDAIRGDQKLVLVIDTTTGKILKKQVGQVWLFDNAAPGFFISDRGRNFTGKPAGTGSIDRDTASSALSPTAPHAAPEAAAVVAAADAALLPARHEPADATMIRMADPLLGWDEGQDVGDYFPDVGEVVLGIAIGEPDGDYGDGTDQTADEWVDDGSDPADDEAVEDGLVAGGDEGADDGSEAGRDGAADDQMITIDDGLVVVHPRDTIILIHPLPPVYIDGDGSVDGGAGADEGAGTDDGTTDDQGLGAEGRAGDAMGGADGSAEGAADAGMAGDAISGSLEALP